MKRRARLLVVDNNLADQEMIREMLPVQGLTDLDIIAVMEGGDAIDFLRQSSARRESDIPDVVLLDLHLSRIHGRDVLAFIRSSPDLKRLPVIMFTTAAGDDVRRRCLELGASDFLIKPRSIGGFSEVATAIKLHLDTTQGRATPVPASP